MGGDYAHFESLRLLSKPPITIGGGGRVSFCSPLSCLMAESVSRSLRDGSLEGEHAPALTIKDSLQSPLGSHAFNHFLSALVSNISTSKSQARGLILVALSQSPLFYFDLLKSKGIDENLIRVLDCYSDPLGWKDRILKSGSSGQNLTNRSAAVFTDLKDTSKLLSSIINIGKDFVGDEKARFAVAIDSVSVILRHVPLQSVASLISNLRSHDHISCMFWSMHSDLHEPRASSALDYISTMVASLEPTLQSPEGLKNPENLFWLEQNSHKGKLHVRLKRRNGRVKLLHEEFYMEKDGIKFTAATISSESIAINQSILPKLQFNLQLSEKEKVDRAKVVLPFEHQGNGETIQIYDGRRPLSEGKTDAHAMQPSALSAEMNNETNTGAGEIHYIRDSDDEAPDSDEDPDDDLDI